MKTTSILCAVALLCGAAAPAFAAEPLHFLIMAAQDPQKEGPKYQALAAYLKAGSPLFSEIQLRIAKNYSEAAQLFKGGDIEGMVAGSFVAGVLIKKELAKPIARPVSTAGVSTYKAIVVAKEGTKPFGGIADFKGKKVAYSALASSGEVFARSLLAAGEKPESVYNPVIAPSHQAALNAVREGVAEYAVVKNTIWKPEDYKGLAVVGSDTEENPDNTVVLSPAAFGKYGAEFTRLLEGLEADKGEPAMAVKKAFGAKGFVATTAKDFSHTFGLMEKARIDAKTFDFAF